MKPSSSIQTRTAAIPRKLLDIVCAGFVALAIPASGGTALWVRINLDPPLPRAGDTVEISVRTLLVEGASCLNDPRATATPVVAFTSDFGPILTSFELQAREARTGEELTICVTRRDDDATVWAGGVVFPHAGQWHLRMTAPSWPGAPDACSGAGRLVTVLPPAAATPTTCPVTVPNDSTPPGESPSASSFYHGNGALWTDLWPEGTVTFTLGGPGSVGEDGSLGMKWPWWRAVQGELVIEGKRLDAPAPPLRSTVPDGYGDFGFQATGLIYPTAGCWEVTGRVGDASLTFVTLVVGPPPPAASPVPSA